MYPNDLQKDSTGQKACSGRTSGEREGDRLALLVLSSRSFQGNTLLPTDHIRNWAMGDTLMQCMCSHHQQETLCEE